MKKLFPSAISALQLITRANRMKTCSGVVTIFFAGCAVLDTHQAKLDQKQLREVLMDYTEDQILDNLIRAYNGHAIVHFDVKTVTATVASKVTPNVGYGRTLTTNQLPGNSVATKTTTAPLNLVTTEVTKTVGVVSAIVGTVTEPFTSSLAAERTNNVLVDVKPQDERKIYAAYIKFLNTGWEDSTSEKDEAEKSAADLGKEPGEGKQDFETSKITKTVTTITEPAPAPTETAGASPTVTPTPTPKGRELASRKTERLPKKPKDKGEDLVVKVHPSPPARAPKEVTSKEVLSETPSLEPLMHDLEKPTKYDHVLVGPKHWKNQYYWVPAEYRQAFFELCVATVTKGASTSSEAEAAKTKAQKDSEEVKDELEDFNSLQRLKLGSPQ